MQSLTSRTNLPEYRDHILRQIEVLKIADGFIVKDVMELLEIYHALLNKVEAILVKDIEVVADVEFNNPATV